MNGDSYCNERLKKTVKSIIKKKDQLLNEADNEKRHSASVDRIIQRKSAPTMKAEIEQELGRQLFEGVARNEIRSIERKDTTMMMDKAITFCGQMSRNFIYSDLMGGLWCGDRRWRSRLLIVKHNGGSVVSLVLFQERTAMDKKPFWSNRTFSI